MRSKKKVRFTVRAQSHQYSSFTKGSRLLRSIRLGTHKDLVCIRGGDKSEIPKNQQFSRGAGYLKTLDKYEESSNFSQNPKVREKDVQVATWISIW